MEQTHIIADQITVKLAFKLIDGFYKTLEKESRVIHKEWVLPQFYETPRGQQMRQVSEYISEMMSESTIYRMYVLKMLKYAK